MGFFELSLDALSWCLQSHEKKIMFVHLPALDVLAEGVQVFDETCTNSVYLDLFESVQLFFKLSGILVKT